MPPFIFFTVMPQFVEIIHVKLKQVQQKLSKYFFNTKLYLSHKRCKVICFKVLWKDFLCEFIRLLHFKCFSIFVPANNIYIFSILNSIITTIFIVFNQLFITSKILQVFDRNPGTVLLFLEGLRLRIYVFGVLRKVFIKKSIYLCFFL